jgi:hypothetical protein
MSDPSSGKGRSGAKKRSKKKNAKRKDALASEGVLANLPRTRPQRSSARREAARRTATTGARSPATAEVTLSSTPSTRSAQRTPVAKAQKTAPIRTQTSASAPIAAKGAAVKKRPAAKAKATTAKRTQDPAPRQGFETERDPITGSVQPPGSLDLLSSAAELAGELAKSGLSTGGRLLRDAFARLPLN